MLLDFAVEGYIGQATKDSRGRARPARGRAHDRDRRGADRVPRIGGGPGQRARRERRAAIEQARLAAHRRAARPLYRELIERQHDRARGARLRRATASMCAGVQGDRPRRAPGPDRRLHRGHRRRLPGACSSPSSSGCSGYRARASCAAPTCRASSAPRTRTRSSRPSGWSQPARDAARARDQSASRRASMLDVEPRPKKSPRAFCAPVRVPDEVYLVIAPVGGRDDFAALFHEAGHTEHYAHVDRELAVRVPLSRRQLDHRGVRVPAPAPGRGSDVARAAARRRRLRASSSPTPAPTGSSTCAATRPSSPTSWSSTARTAHSDELADRYAELLGGALRIEWPRETYLADVDPGFYCACYLRAWALETHLRAHLRERVRPGLVRVPGGGRAAAAAVARGPAADAPRSCSRS